jgi:hypothetical protein
MKVLLVVFDDQHHAAKSQVDSIAIMISTHHKDSALSLLPFNSFKAPVAPSHDSRYAKWFVRTGLLVTAA